ncbi:MAG: glycosyltransferase family 39 protein, partial [Victivallaceae bacterium]
MKINPTTLYPLLRPALIFAATALWFGAFAPLGIDFHHDGIMFKAAADIADGKALFRDTFSQYGMLIPFVQALPLRLFGSELLFLKLETVLFYALAAVVLDRLFRPYLSTAFQWLLLALYWTLAPELGVTMHPWSSVPAMLTMLLAGLFFCRYFDRNRAADLIGAGVMAGLAFGLRQPCGAVLLAAGVIALGIKYFVQRPPLLSAIRELGIYLAGTGAVLATYAIYLTAVGAWQDYYTQCIRFPLQFAGERSGGNDWGQIFDSFIPLGSGFTVFPWVCFGVFLYSIWRLWRQKESKYLNFATLAVIGLASYHQYHPVPCVRHLYWAAVPMMGVYVIALNEIWRAPILRRSVRVAAIVFLLTGPGLTAGIRLYTGYDRLVTMGYRQRLDVEGLRGMLLTPSEARYVLRFRAVLEAIPEVLRGRGRLNLTGDGLYAVLLAPDVVEPHRVFVNWGDLVYGDYSQVVGDFVRRERPVILSKKPVPYPGYRPFAGFPAKDPE